MGEPGQGKSTLLRQYALRLASNGDERLPLLIELREKRDWREGAAIDFGWLHERLRASLQHALGEKGWDACCRFLRAGRAIVLLDGLDELSDQARRHVTDLVGTLAGNQVVLSSRPHVYRRDPLGGFKVYTLGGLGRSQVDRLAANFCRALAGEYGVDPAEVLAKVLEASRGQAAAMVRNPLLLSFLCFTAVERAAQGKLEDFPTRPAPLIGECVDALVAWHRKRPPGQDWPEDLGGNRVIRILGKLALESFRDRTGVVRQEEVEELAEPDRKHFHEHLVPARLVEQQHRDYVFPLETLREYLAARAVAAGPDPFSALKRHLHHPEWQQVILYTAGSLKEERAARLDVWCPGVTWFFVKTAGALMRILARVLPFLTQGKPIGDAGDQAIEELAPLVQEPLGRWLTRSRHSTEFFITAIWKHHCRWRWQRYERKLGRDLRLAGRCLGAVGCCPDRLAARLADQLAREALLRDDFSGALAAAAQNGKVRQRWLGQARVKRDRDGGVRWAAIEALAVAAAVPDVREELLELTRQEGEWLRRKAAKALAGAADEPEVQERLLELMRDEEWVRSGAVEALAGAAVVPEVRERLLELARDKESGVSGEAVEALAGAATVPEVQEHLVELMRDEEWGVREAAVKALAGAVTAPEVQRRLLEMTRDTRATVRSNAAEALAGSATEPEVRERLLELTRYEDEWARRAAAKALAGAATEPEVQRRLLELTRDTAEWTRKGAAEALAGAAAESEVRERLLELTRDKDEWVREAAAKALAGAVADPKVRKRLFRLTRGLGWNPMAYVLPVYLLLVLLYLGLLAVSMSVLALEWGLPRLVGLAGNPTWIRGGLTWVLGGLGWVQGGVRWVLEWSHAESVLNWSLLLLGLTLALQWGVPWLARWGRNRRLGLAAVEALRAWKVPVSRFALWRVARMARPFEASATETLEAMVQLWEEQHPKPRAK